MTYGGERVMRSSLTEADSFRGGHGPDADSAGDLRGTSPLPRRGGQLADYYPVIAQAVNRLEPSTAETRRKIYGRARAAMVAQLRSLAPPLRESDINLEQLALERAIRKVETESVGRSRRSPRPSIQPNPPPGPVRDTSDEQAEMRDVGGPSRNAMWPPTSMADGNFPLATMNNPDLAAELAILQKEIRRNRRGSLIILRARNLVPLTIMGLLVLSFAAWGAY
jgi:hypothetical protein